MAYVRQFWGSSFSELQKWLEILITECITVREQWDNRKTVDATARLRTKEVGHIRNRFSISSKLPFLNDSCKVIAICLLYKKSV